MALTDIIFGADNSVAANRGDIGTLVDILAAEGFSISVSAKHYDGPTYSIGGVVTLSAVGVVGAELSIIVADDTNMANAYLQEVVLSGAGGTWSANVPVGKMAFVQAQNYNAGTYYTAPAAPFIS